MLNDGNSGVEGVGVKLVAELADWVGVGVVFGASVDFGVVVEPGVDEAIGVGVGADVGVGEEDDVDCTTVIKGEGE